MQEKNMLPNTRLRATHLYLDIQRHFARGGNALSLRDINRMVGLRSSASAQMYVGILQRWGLIRRIPKGVRTIVLAPNTKYPPVEYRTDVKRSNDHA